MGAVNGPKVLMCTDCLNSVRLEIAVKEFLIQWSLCMKTGNVRHGRESAARLAKAVSDINKERGIDA